MRSLSWRWAIVLITLLACIACLLPNFMTVPAWMPSTAVKLGLDLQGGINLTLGVDIQQASINSLALTGQELRSLASEQGITVLSPRINSSGALEFALPKADQSGSLEALLRDRFGQLAATPPANSPEGGLIYTLTMEPRYQAHFDEQTLEQTINTLRGRIDQFGVAEPDIRKQGDNQIQIQLPGMTDPQRAIELIGQTAVLTFHGVRSDARPGAVLPPGAAWYPSKEGGMLALNTQPLMTGQDVADARPAFDDKGQSYVALTFNRHGAETFERVTGELLHQPLAIVLDGVVQSAPVIQQQISGGHASISGRFTTAQAQDLSIVLRAGSLPAPVKVLEERSVGPSLGRESIQSGLMAGLVGALGVMLFMAIYYGKSGLMADAMLLFTLGLLFAGLGAFGGTLTMPGIAGVVLTIGMAVDANVLIYERIREELRGGKDVKAAVHAGFERAAVSITDSNLTTIIAAAVLYQFGTGPIRGFAVTLTLGIVASMFTAIFVSRLLFEAWLRYNGGKGLGLGRAALPQHGAA